MVPRVFQRLHTRCMSHPAAGTHWLSSVRGHSEELAGQYREGMRRCGYTLRSIESALKFSLHLQPRLKNVVRLTAFRALRRPHNQQVPIQSLGVRHAASFPCHFSVFDSHLPPNVPQPQPAGAWLRAGPDPRNSQQRHVFVIRLIGVVAAAFVFDRILQRHQQMLWPSSNALPPLISSLWLVLQANPSHVSADERDAAAAGSGPGALATARNMAMNQLEANLQLRCLWVIISEKQMVHVCFPLACARSASGC
jgi:hypothetical protein